MFRLVTPARCASPSAPHHRIYVWPNVKVKLNSVLHVTQFSSPFKGVFQSIYSKKNSIMSSVR